MDRKEVKWRTMMEWKWQITWGDESSTRLAFIFHERKLHRYTGPYRDPNRLKSPCPSQLSKAISAKMAHNRSTVSLEQ
jgi:hypothetical protein